MADWWDSLIGAVGDVADTAGNAYGSYVAGKDAKANAEAQRAYLQNLTVYQAQQTNAQENRALAIGAGILIFAILLRQTAQAR
jgi:hypothetical protein